MIARIDRIIGGLAFAMAMLAGVALVFVTLVTTASITGRNLLSLGLSPVPGDVEIVEMATAFAVTACLSWCQWRRGHITVDIVLGHLGPRFNTCVDLAANILMTAAAIVIAWRVGIGMEGKFGNQFAIETTFILGLPIWWSYAAVLAGACVFALTCGWTVIRSAGELRR